MWLKIPPDCSSVSLSRSESTPGVMPTLGGLREDLKRRAPCFLDDWTSAFTSQYRTKVLSSTYAKRDRTCGSLQKCGERTAEARQGPTGKESSPDLGQQKRAIGSVGNPRFFLFFACLSPAIAFGGLSAAQDFKTPWLELRRSLMLQF